jgi:hypothetical protein
MKSLPHKSLTRRQAMAGLAGALSLAVAGRIRWLNANDEGLEVIEHPMGEWVDLDGAFSDVSSENTKGYYLRVSDAQIMSYNQYVETYATDGSTVREGFDVPSLAVLTVDIKNDGHEGDGGLNLFEMYLVPVRMNEYLIEDADLFLLGETKLRESGSNGWKVGIKEGTEYQVHLPFIHNTSTPECYERQMNDTEFLYYVSNLPVRHAIRASV